MHQVNSLSFLFFSTSGSSDLSPVWAHFPPHLGPGSHQGPLTPSPVVPCCPGSDLPFPVCLCGFVPWIQEHILPEKECPGGVFSENLLVGKMGLCSSNSWFARLAGHQIQGWKPFSFQLLKISLHCLLASRVAVFWFLVWPVLFSLKVDRILFLSPVLWDFQVTCPGAGLFSSVMLSSYEILPSGIMSFSSRTFSGIPSWFLLLGFL